MHVPQIVIPDPVVFVWGMIFAFLLCLIYDLWKHPREE